MPLGYYGRNFGDRIRRALGYHAFCFCCWLGCGLLWIAKKLSGHGGARQGEARNGAARHGGARRG